MIYDQRHALDADGGKARRKAEEQFRNQKAQAEAKKAELLKKERKIRECQEQIRRMDHYAERCLMEGQEQKAAVYLERKIEWETRLAVLIQESGFAVTGTSPLASQEDPESNKAE